MKLLGRDFSPEALLTTLEANLVRRGLVDPKDATVRFEGLEPRVDPAAFNVEALTEHADPTVALPLETHRGGVTGRAVVLLKWGFRKGFQMFINEAFGRQRVFNGHVRDAYAQLSSEVNRLHEEIERLKQAPVHRAPAPRAPRAKKAARPNKS